MTAELEADQVVLLVVGERAADAVFTHLFAFQVVRVRRRRPDGLGPSVLADGRGDVLLSDVRVEDAGRARNVGAVRALGRGSVRRDDGEAEQHERNYDEHGAQRHARKVRTASRYRKLTKAAMAEPRPLLRWTTHADVGSERCCRRADDRGSSGRSRRRSLEGVYGREGRPDLRSATRACPRSM